MENLGSTPVNSKRRGIWPAGGLLASLALHLSVVMLFVFGLPWPTPAPPTSEIVPVELVFLGAETKALASPDLARLPQEKARQVAETDAVEAVPPAQTPPPPGAPRKAEARSTQPVPVVVPPTLQRSIAAPVKGPVPDKLPAGKVLAKPLPIDPLRDRLERLAQLRQPEPPVPAERQRQEGVGASNRTSTSADAALATNATYSVRDFIRAQVLRRWNLDGKAVRGTDWTVAIHVLVNPDGSINQVEIVDDPRYSLNRAYRDFALSARNAVLLSAPLLIPPGEYDIAKDIVLDFDPRQVLK